MNTIEDKVDETMDTVLRHSRALSRKAVAYQEQIDRELDSILEFKQMMLDGAAEVKAINDSLEHLTWSSHKADKKLLETVENVETVCTLLLHGILLKEKELLETLSLYQQFPNIVAPFIDEIDNLQENLETLHEVFFDIPNDEEFQRINGMLTDCK